MLSTLASLFFGAKATDEELNSYQSIPKHVEGMLGDDAEPEHTIEVTRLTPSVAGSHVNCADLESAPGASAVERQTKRQSRRNRNNSAKAKRRGGVDRTAVGQEQLPSIAKLLNPTGDGVDDDDATLDDGWLIVDKEDEDLSLPRTDSEEELSIVEIKQKAASSTAGACNAAIGQQRRRIHINSHSLYNGPRPQLQRNLQQRMRNGGNRVCGGVVALSRNITGGNIAADGVITQSLYAVGSGKHGGSDSALFGAKMEESWYVTPPPCFTTIGPINVEVSPFENLLIEHPSMSVYHSIRSAQEATESFVNLDLGVDESQQALSAWTQSHPQPLFHIQAQLRSNSTDTAGVTSESANGATTTSRPRYARIDTLSANLIKQQLLARSAQKTYNKRERQPLCRGAIARANKVRDVQSNGQRQRRADMQQCRIVSGANNNRKCKF